jgi:cytoskeletal protein CcmA (bactofilin family)
MASTTFSGPVTSTNGFIGAVTGNVAGNVTGTVTGNVVATAGFIQLRTATSVQIAAIANAVNTTGKVAGTIVFDTTLGTLKIATGANANSTWVNADGTTAVTPS